MTAFVALVTAITLRRELAGLPVIAAAETTTALTPLQAAAPRSSRAGRCQRPRPRVAGAAVDMSDLTR